jgi:hypothetical protein
MITVHDFTVLPEGRYVPLGGSVIHCPSCNRNGVFEKEPGGARCVHAETVDVHGDGMRVEPTDCCELTKD